MKRTYLSTVLLFIILTSLLFSQREQLKFSLSNYSTFGTGEKIIISLYAPPEVKSFTFRLLRLNDPVNLLKSGMAARMRNNFDIWGKDKELLTKYFSLEREWNEVISRTSGNWYGNTISVKPVDEAGIYILQALRDDQVAYCPIVVSNYALIFKNSNSEVLAFLVNARTGKFIPETKFSFYKKDSLIESGTAGEDGFFLLKTTGKLKGNETLLISSETEDEIVFSNPYFFFADEYQRYTAYTFTNQPVYRPGQKVFFKSILRKKDEFDFSVLKDEVCKVVIRSPKNAEVFSDSLRTNEFGSIWGEFVLDEEAEIGSYSIQVTLGERTFYGSFKVEEYKKPEYKVEVTTDKKNYSGSETISGTVKADYYFGSPVTTAKVTVQIYKKRFWIPWWHWSEYNWYYGGLDRISYAAYGQPDFVKQIDGEVNEKGEFQFEFSAEKPTDFDFTYEISAQVEDASRRAISNSTTVYVTRGAFSLSTSTSKYFIALGDSVQLRVNAFDFSQKPVETNFEVIINKLAGHENMIVEKVEKFSGSTGKDGKATLAFLPHEAGQYNYVIIAYDLNENKISTSGSFFVNDKNNFYYQRSGNEIEIVTDKDAYEVGDTLTAIISLPGNDPSFETDVLVSFERNSILKFRKYPVEGNSLIIKEKLTENYSPNFTLSVLFMHERNLNSNSKMIGVLNKNNFLSLEIKPAKMIFKPGEKAAYKISVKNNNGKPVANTELSLGLIDESIYAIQEETTDDIKNFFYRPEHSYIPMSSSLNSVSFSASSRQTTLLDRNLLNSKELKNNGSSSLEGRIIFDEHPNDSLSLCVLIVNEHGYFITRTHGRGEFTFKNIPGGDYEFCILTLDGKFKFVKNIFVEDKKKNVQGIRESGFEMREVLTDDVEVRGARVQIRKDFTNATQIESNLAIKASSEKDVQLVTPEVRKNFVDAAFWQPGFVTDENGEAEISLTLPDNLTSWRATVRGITKNTEVGQGTNIIIARKNLLVRTETPRFFREGDTLLIATNIHNYLNENKKVKVAFKSKNVKLLSSSIEKKDEIFVKENDEARVDWKIVVEKSRGEAEIYIEALTNEESDAMQVSVPILPYGVKQTVALNAIVQENTSEENIAFTISKDVDLHSAEISFSLSPTLAGTMLKSVDDLVAYPYGCVEQTMSRFLPAIIVANTFKELQIPLKEKTSKELPEVIAKGLKWLYAFQHGDGGWGWWEKDQTHPYMTAYVVYGLSLAKLAGYEINEDIFQRGKENLLQQLKTIKKEEQTTIAYMFYSLVTADIKDFKDAKSLLDEISKKESNAYTLALLASVYQKLGDKENEKKVFERLMNNINENEKFAYWGGKQWHYRWEDDKVQSTAFALKYLLSMDAKSPAIPKTVSWLLQQQRGYSWNSTQQTASVLFALTDYLKITKELEPDYTVSVLLNDEKIAEKQFNTKNIFEENEKLSFGVDKLKRLNNGENKISIVKSGRGTLYFSGYNRYFAKPENLVKQNSFDVKKEYYKLTQFKGESGIIYKKEKIKKPLNSGDDVFVKLTVEMNDEDFQYFMLEDPFPSGFEIVKDEEHYNIDGEDQYQGNIIRRGKIKHWRWNYASKEIRDEKIAFFVTYPSKEMEFTYIIKAQIPGTYSWLPAEASLMYYPEVNGLSGNYKLGIRN
ncbi:MAG: MG2 domain-containing protein [Ignavibacteriaceae bacterium]|nr:MG2 domain-containing protein [Ignavibacteriaceae bacterium]